MSETTPVIFIDIKLILKDIFELLAAVSVNITNAIKSFADIGEAPVQTTSEGAVSKKSKDGDVTKAFKSLFASLKPITLLIKLIEPISEPFEMLAEIFVDELSPIIYALLPFLYDLVNVFVVLLTYLTPIITAIAGWIEQNVTLTNLWNGLKALWAAFQTILQPLITLFIILWNVFSILFNSLKAVNMSAIGTFIKDVFSAIIGFIWDFIKGLSTLIKDWGKQIISWIWEGIKNAGASMGTAVKDWWTTLWKK